MRVEALTEPELALTGLSRLLELLVSSSLSASLESLLSLVYWDSFWLSLFILAGVDCWFSVQPQGLSRQRFCLPLLTCVLGTVDTSHRKEEMLYRLQASHARRQGTVDRVVGSHKRSHSLGKDHTCFSDSDVGEERAFSTGESELPHWRVAQSQDCSVLRAAGR